MNPKGKFTKLCSKRACSMLKMLWCTLRAASWAQAPMTWEPAQFWRSFKAVTIRLVSWPVLTLLYSQCLISFKVRSFLRLVSLPRSTLSILVWRSPLKWSLMNTECSSPPCKIRFSIKSGVGRTSHSKTLSQTPEWYTTKIQQNQIKRLQLRSPTSTPRITHNSIPWPMS